MGVTDTVPSIHARFQHSAPQAGTSIGPWRDVSKCNRHIGPPAESIALRSMRMLRVAILCFTLTIMCLSCFEPVCHPYKCLGDPAMCLDTEQTRGSAPFQRRKTSTR